jgi:hypothetical protein
MKTAFALLAIAFSAAAHAEGWGGFSGYNASKQLVTLAPWDSTDSPNNPNIEDIRSWVYVGTAKAQYAVELNDLCHRYKNSTQSKADIWCDGNKDSPLHGVTYRWVKTIKGPSNEDYSDKQIWECFSGCSPRAPKRMLYEH